MRDPARAGPDRANAFENVRRTHSPGRMCSHGAAITFARVTVFANTRVSTFARAPHIFAHFQNILAHSPYTNIWVTCRIRRGPSHPPGPGMHSPASIFASENIHQRKYSPAKIFTSEFTIRPRRGRPPAPDPVGPRGAARCRLRLHGMRGCGSADNLNTITAHQNAGVLLRSNPRRL